MRISGVEHATTLRFSRSTHKGKNHGTAYPLTPARISRAVIKPQWPIRIPHFAAVGFGLRKARWGLLYIKGTP